MYEDFMLNNDYSELNVDSVPKSEASVSLDNLFDNLTSDIDNFNKYIDNVNKKREENREEEKELLEEKQRIEKAKIDFENYVRQKNKEYESKMAQVDIYLNGQKQNLVKAEAEFKVNMDNSLNELELIKKELELQKEKLKEEKEQFETYKNLELNRINHSQKILESEKSQFEKYKEVNTKKIELENKNLEQKCDKFKELIGQFNAKFNPMLNVEE